MAKKRYANVVDMMRDLSEDATFADDLDKHLAGRRLITQLVALRAAQGLTQKELGDKAGFTQSRISKLEASEDADLTLSTVMKYAGAIGLNVEITLVPRGVSLVDRVKHHAFCIKRLTDSLAKLGTKDERIADGVGDFLKEAASNLVRLIQRSRELLPSPRQESASPISIDVFGVGHGKGVRNRCSANM